MASTGSILFGSCASCGTSSRTRDFSARREATGPPPTTIVCMPICINAMLSASFICFFAEIWYLSSSLCRDAVGMHGVPMPVWFPRWQTFPAARKRLVDIHPACLARDRRTVPEWLQDCLHCLEASPSTVGFRIFMQPALLLDPTRILFRSIRRTLCVSVGSYGRPLIPGAFHSYLSFIGLSRSSAGMQQKSAAAAPKVGTLAALLAINRVSRESESV